MAVGVGDLNIFAAGLEWMCHGAAELCVRYLHHTNAQQA